MRILRLHAVNFGTLSDFRMELSEGLNVLHRQNGWGKSTLAAFIKAMLYGLPATTKQSLDENERKKYAPWQGGAYGGTLEFSSAKGAFRIERFFGAKESADSFTLYDLSTNLPSSAYTSAVGVDLFGIDADGFERTVYLSQRAVKAKGENSSITAKLGGLLEDVDDIGSFEDAMSILEKQRKYYVMTGNKGRVAELERRCAEEKRELEELLRVQATVEEKEKQLALCNAEMSERKQALDKVRADLRRAGFLREQAALSEQKQGMLDELAELDAQRKQIDRSLHGQHPTEEELQEAMRLVNSLREQNARLRELENTSVSVDVCELLPTSYRGELPDGNVFFQLTNENNRLQRLSQRESELHSRQQHRMQERFPKGVPSKEELNAAFLTVERAKKPSSDAEAAPSLSRPSLLPTVILAVLAVFGAGICLAGVLFTHLLLSLIGGVALLAFGIVALCALLRYRKMLTIARREEARRKNAKDVAERSLASVYAFLSSYGMSRTEDPIRALTELSYLSDQYRAERAQNGQLQAELVGVQKEKAQCATALQGAFRAYGISLPMQGDYRDEIEALHRDVRMLQRAKTDEEEKKRSISALKGDIADRKARLAPFLNRYDPERRLAPMECLRALEKQEHEYRRLSDEIERREQALRKFIQQKNPKPVDTSEPVDADRLEAEAQALTRQIETLQKQALETAHAVEELSMKADCIPEARSRIQSLEEEYALAKANHTTVSNTQKLLEEAKNGLSTRYLGGMQESFGRFLSVLFSDDTPESVMDPTFTVSLRREGKTRPVESFSRGWRDAVQLCVRLSLTEALYAEGEKPLLLLDDPFVNFDEERLAAAKQLLTVLSKSYQIVYMVCHAERE